jgi:hypothetical protein
MRPLIQWARVDFPEPEGPRMRIFSPLLTLKLMPVRLGATWERYRKEKSLKTKAGMDKVNIYIIFTIH